MLRIAPETITLSERRGHRAGRRVAPPPQRNPGRWVHAYQEGGEKTLCGLDLTGLHAEEFPNWEFDRVAPALRCEECQQRA